MSKKEVFDFSKPGEAIYFKEGRVVKYFEDPKIVSARVERAEILKGLVPEVTQVDENHYSYSFVDGETMYDSLEPGLASTFLEWSLKNLWNPNEIELNEEQELGFSRACMKFYKSKTLDRVSLYWNTVTHKDKPSLVNGVQTAALSDLLEKIDWEELSKGVASRFHGDLQFDNVLYSEDPEQPFVLLDWRHEFAGLMEYGDMYYDLAKLYGGLLIPYSSIKMNLFDYQEDGDNITLSVQPSAHLDSAKLEFEDFVRRNGLDFQKIELLAGVIFINMSPLHTKPFNHLLHHFGKLILTQNLYA